MQSALAQRMDQLVELGWEPHTTTETSASLIGRRPFSWWLFLLVIFFIPGFGGLFYLVFWVVLDNYFEGMKNTHKTPGCFI